MGLYPPSSTFTPPGVPILTVRDVPVNTNKNVDVKKLMTLYYIMCLLLFLLLIVILYQQICPALFNITVKQYKPSHKVILPNRTAPNASLFFSPPITDTYLF
jgi:hypothetical protein